MSSKPKLIDRFQRSLNYLRISITDHCNLRCLYCAPNNLIPKLRHDEILTYEEILRIVKVGAGLGISKVRVTGGEPLTRKGVDHFLEQLCTLDGIDECSLTTNGVLLESHLTAIQEAGVKRLNISLDTLSEKRYKSITGRDQFNKTWDAIMAAHAMGFDPIKINVVMLKGHNDKEWVNLAKLTYQYPFRVRFIEYMPIGRAAQKRESSLQIETIKTQLAQIEELIPITHNPHDGPAERWRFKSAQGEIGFIGALSNHFCGTCNRLRLTASGQLRACLLADREIDIKTPLRSGATDAELAQLFLAAAQIKPERHHLSDDPEQSASSEMSSIGG